ncbi:hypothetical protein F8M49_20930 [Rhodococcus zopfii]|uniref:Uncharacterized protein n=1 Tax=Rhodococcus zopfii TaxID=43772 RepID=A0ABU3WU06_9NOCA|nr:hypothetical protein [Rhodococcus zopfii]
MPDHVRRTVSACGRRTAGGAGDGSRRGGRMVGLPAEERRIAFHRWLGRTVHHTDLPTAGQLDLPLPLLTDRKTP